MRRKRSFASFYSRVLGLNIYQGSIIPQLRIRNRKQGAEYYDRLAAGVCVQVDTSEASREALVRATRVPS